MTEPEVGGAAGPQGIVAPTLRSALAARTGGGAVAAVSDRRRRSEIDATIPAVGTPPPQSADLKVSATSAGVPPVLRHGQDGRGTPPNAHLR